MATLALSCAAKADPAAGSLATVQRGNLNINILASGNLKTAREENLAFYSAGTVQEVLVKIGDTVQSGKALAILDKAALESALADAQINVKQARLDLESAKDVATNAAGEATGAPNPLKIEKQEQVLKKAQDSLVEAEKLLQKATIGAPFAGLIAEVNVVAGDQVSASTVAVRLIDPINFQTAVLVNEMQVYQLQIGTPATVEVVAVPNVTFPAMVKLISETPTVSSNVVNYTVTVALDPVDAAAIQALSAGQTTPGLHQAASGSRAPEDRHQTHRRPPIIEHFPGRRLPASHPTIGRWQIIEPPRGVHLQDRRQAPVDKIHRSRLRQPCPRTSV